MRHEFICSLGGGIEGKRLIDGIIFPEGHLRISSIDGAAGCIEKMLDAFISALFQDITESYEVGVYILPGMIKRMAHARLGGKMNDHAEIMFRKELRYDISVGYIALDENKIIELLQSQQPSFLQFYFIIIIEIVKSRYLVAPF